MQRKTNRTRHSNNKKKKKVNKYKPTREKNKTEKNDLQTKLTIFKFRKKATIEITSNQMTNKQHPKNKQKQTFSSKI